MKGGKTDFIVFFNTGAFPRLFALAGACALVFLFSGCAYHKTGERLDLLEARMDGQQVHGIRLDNLEERVTALESDVGVLRAGLSSEKKGAKPSPRTIKKRGAATVGDAPSMGLPENVRTPSLATATVSSPVSSAGMSPAPSPPAGPIDQTAIDRTIAELRTARETPSVASAPAGNAKASSGDKKAYAAALGLYEQKKYREAEKQFTEFLERYPASKLAPNAMYWYAECFYSRKEYATAIVNFKNVAAKYPKHDKAAAALYKVGLSYRQLKDTENARFYWRILQDDFPTSAPARLADKQLKTV